MRILFPALVVGSALFATAALADGPGGHALGQDISLLAQPIAPPLHPGQRLDASNGCADDDADACPAEAVALDR